MSWLVVPRPLTLRDNGGNRGVRYYVANESLRLKGAAAIFTLLVRSGPHFYAFTAATSFSLSLSVSLRQLGSFPV